MRILFYTVLTTTLLFCFLTFDTNADENRNLRVLSYNIHIGIGTDGKLDIERTARAIMEQKPDLVALQEVDRVTERVRNMDQVEELSRLTGMNVVFGKTVDRSKGDYGIAIMSRFPISEYKMIQLPKHEKEEDRGVLAASIAIDDQTKIRFLCTHFCHVYEERRVRQAEMINKLFAQDDVVTILGADFNAYPDSKTLKTILTKWEDSTNRTPTFPSSNAKAKIDYILYRPKETLKVIDTKVIEEKTTSDHYPVLSIFEL